MDITAYAQNAAVQAPVAGVTKTPDPSAVVWGSSDAIALVFSNVLGFVSHVLTAALSHVQIFLGSV